MTKLTKRTKMKDLSTKIGNLEADPPAACPTCFATRSRLVAFGSGRWRPGLALYDARRLGVRKACLRGRQGSIPGKVSILILLLLAGCAKENPQPPGLDERILAQFDGQTITIREFKVSFGPIRNQYKGEEVELRAIKERVLNQLIDEKLMLREAGRLSLGLTDEEVASKIKELTQDYPEDLLHEMLQAQGVIFVQWKKHIQDQLLIEKLIASQVYRKVKVSESEIKRYYAEHPDEFKRPQEVRARQIVVATLVQANNILDWLKGGEDFADLARKFSISPDGKKGGDLGFFSRGQMPEEFEETVFALSVGQISDATKTPYGYHIFKLEEIRGPRHQELAEVRERIRDKLRRVEEEAALQEWLKGLREGVKVGVNRDLLDNL